VDYSLQKVGGANSELTPIFCQRANAVERAIQNLKNQLKIALLDNKQTIWDQKLNDALLYLRNKTNQTTEFSPAEILFGRKIKTPQNTALALTQEEMTSLDNWAEAQSQTIKAIQAVAFQNMKNSVHKLVEPFNKKRDGKATFNKGDMAWVKYRPLSKKSAKFTKALAERYKGPYELKEKLSEEIFLIAPKKQPPTKIHIQDLKKFYGSPQKDKTKKQGRAFPINEPTTEEE